MEQDKHVSAIINRLKKQAMPAVTIGRRHAPRARQSVRRPGRDGVMMAREVVADFEKELRKIN
jgi:hypothetical protein